MSSTRSTNRDNVVSYKHLHSKFADKDAYDVHKNTWADAHRLFSSTSHTTSFARRCEFFQYVVLFAWKRSEVLQIINSSVGLVRRELQEDVRSLLEAANAHWVVTLRPADDSIWASGVSATIAEEEIMTKFHHQLLYKPALDWYWNQRKFVNFRSLS